MIIDMEEELTKAMIECEMGDRTWCMTNFECGSNEACFDPAIGSTFEDMAQKC